LVEVASGESSSRRFAKDLFTPVTGRYDRLAEWLSFGQNSRWRREMVTRVLDREPALVCDVATGTAGVALQLSSRGGGRVVGVDLTEAMVRRARQNVEKAGAAQSVVLAVGDAGRLPFSDSTFDALSFTYLLRYVEDPGATLAELARVVRPGGVVASLEFAVPENPLWRSCWWLYTRAVLPLAGWLTGGRPWLEVGRFLGPSISAHYRTYPVSRTVEAWRDAGLTEVQVLRMSMGGGLVMRGVRAGPRRLPDA
jgi:demethylmenaquinone methyltransferase/2-methoxy-6-polyprenyl-1,4-benzoquinol methylase